MSRSHTPRHGSMQFWPRKRARHSLARVRSWPLSSQAKPLAFIAYKVGMSHLIALDRRPHALTKGEEISLPATIFDCPPLLVAGVAFYKNHQKNGQILAPQLDKDLARKFPLPKRLSKKWEDFPDFDDLQLLVHSQPKLTPADAKKPKLLEIALGGSQEEKLSYAKQKLGQEIRLEEVFEPGLSVDVHGITKGKGFQGTVKRFGVPLRQHKAEKTKRGIGTLGPWQPKRVLFTVPQSGKMGYHLRTEYNKQILKISGKPQEINLPSGFKHYGLVKNSCLFLKGSVPGPRKRPLLLLPSLRPNPAFVKDSFEVKLIAK